MRLISATRLNRPVCPSLARHSGMSAAAKAIIEARRRSRALVRMMSSSFCVVAAWTGAATHWPPRLTSRSAVTRSASARRSIGGIAIGDDASDAQPVFAREIQVALVMRRHAHHRAGAIVHQHEVCDIDGQRDARVHRMLHPIAGVEAKLFLGFQLGRGGAARLAALDEGRCLGIRLSQLVRDRSTAPSRFSAAALPMSSRTRARRPMAR